MNPEPPSDQVRRSFQLSGPVDRFVTPTCQKARQVYTMQRRKRVGGVGRIGLVGGGEHVTVSKKVPAGNADLQVPVAPTLWAGYCSDRLSHSSSFAPTGNDKVGWPLWTTSTNQKFIHCGLNGAFHLLILKIVVTVVTTINLHNLQECKLINFLETDVIM